MFTVLIVDDEEGFLQIIQVILKRAGYKTLVANNGTDGLEMVRQYRPDIVILDDMMPGLTGGEVCTQIKSDPEISATIVVMHSAGAKVRNPAYIQQIGADGVLFKPSLPNDIVEMMTNCLTAKVG
jgi:CheY-like chemotaxis protein